MEIITHLKINQQLCGKPVEVTEDGSRVEMLTTEEMAADELGLVHGGFVFGLADYAAMIAVNDPNVVLGGAEVRFLKPVKVGQTVTAAASVVSEKGKKRAVSVRAEVEGEGVFEGSFVCFVLDKHVLEA